MIAPIHLMSSQFHMFCFFQHTSEEGKKSRLFEPIESAALHAFAHNLFNNKNCSSFFSPTSDSVRLCSLFAVITENKKYVWRFEYVLSQNEWINWHGANWKTIYDCYIRSNYYLMWFLSRWYATSTIFATITPYFAYCARTAKTINSSTFNLD